MPIDDFLDPAQEGRRLKKAQQRAWVSGGQAGGDSDHLGAGALSIQIGDAAEAVGSRSVAIGQASYADAGSGGGGYSTALGAGSYADADAVAVGANSSAQGVESVAIGDGSYAYGERSVSIGKGAIASNDDDFVLGTSSHNVIVPGTFSNPSARHLKQNIVPVDDVGDVFPELVEYEKKAAPGKRHLGYIAGDLVGTDAERFLVLDGDGQPAAIAYQDLHTAQIHALYREVVALRAEIAELRNERD